MWFFSIIVRKAYSFFDTVWLFETFLFRESGTRFFGTMRLSERKNPNFSRRNWFFVSSLEKNGFRVLYLSLRVLFATVKFNKLCAFWALSITPTFPSCFKWWIVWKSVRLLNPWFSVWSCLFGFLFKGSQVSSQVFAKHGFARVQYGKEKLLTEWRFFLHSSCSNVIFKLVMTKMTQSKIFKFYTPKWPQKARSSHFEPVCTDFKQV